MNATGLVALLALATATPTARAEPPAWRVTLDLGVPDALVASLGHTLTDHATVFVGVGHNSNSPGLRAGLRVHPRTRTVTPYLAVDGGIYAEADTPAWMRSAARSVGLNDKTLERLGYRYGNAHAGLEFGGDGVRFFVQAGVSVVDAAALIIKPKPTYVPPVELYRDTEVRAWIIAGRLGVTFAF